jgi:hypothetical protein
VGQGERVEAFGEGGGVGESGGDREQEEGELGKMDKEGESGEEGPTELWGCGIE